MAESQEAMPIYPSANGKKNNDSDGMSHLANLTAQATLRYSVKDYDAAAELYSQATELQAEINGEMSSQNADLLYAYGRCLYHVAVKKSDVLGSKIAGEKQEGSKKPRKKKPEREQAVISPEALEERTAEEIVTKVVEEKDGAIKTEKELDEGMKPLFQFTGDENWDTSEEEEDEDEDDQDEADAEDGDDEDDFVNAYEVLDLARVLLLKNVRDLENAAGKATGESQGVRQLKERLADTYDLQAEISLEGGKFPAAVVDLKSALELKLALFPQQSSLLAEAHYKLSLALEFSSVTQQTNEKGEIEAGQEAQVDEAMREESAREMEAAIASCKLRVQKEEATLSNGEHTSEDAKKRDVIKCDIEDVREMIKEMEQRLIELRQPPVSISDPRGTGTLDGSNPMTGILGSILGESRAAQMARLEEASKGAQDLTNLVKRKKPIEDRGSNPAGPSINSINGKRKIDLAEEVEEVGTEKRAKIVKDDDF